MAAQRVEVGVRCRGFKNDENNSVTGMPLWMIGVMVYEVYEVKRSGLSMSASSLEPDGWRDSWFVLVQQKKRRC